MTNQANGLRLDMRTVLNAPRERVFRALTEAASLTRWWGPAGFTMPEIELDLRVGGRYRFTMRPPDGDPFHLAGEFLAIDSPRHLAYTFSYEEPDPDDRETVVTLALAAVGEGMELALSQGDFATEPRLALHRSGWTESLDRLRQFVDSVG